MIRVAEILELKVSETSNNSYIVDRATPNLIYYIRIYVIIDYYC